MTKNNIPKHVYKKVSLFSNSESKLNKVQGKNRHGEPNPRDMIDGLTRVKEDHMARFISQTAERCFIPDGAMDDHNDASPAALLQRRLHPEKQALNPEEIVVLVNADELNKIAADKELVLTDRCHDDLPSKPEDS